MSKHVPVSSTHDKFWANNFAGPWTYTKLYNILYLCWGAVTAWFEKYKLLKE